MYQLICNCRRVDTCHFSHVFCPYLRIFYQLSKMDDELIQFSCFKKKLRTFLFLIPFFTHFTHFYAFLRNFTNFYAFLRILLIFTHFYAILRILRIFYAFYSFLRILRIYYSYLPGRCIISPANFYKHFFRYFGG